VIAATPERRPIARVMLEGDPLAVAPWLLGKLLVHGTRVGRIVEVEAYRGAEDPASHAYRGRTARNSTMFGRAGLLYVYFTYGMHWCANVVCGPDGVAGAVLLRALEPLSGLDEMRMARSRRRKDGRAPSDRDLCRGPANLACAMGIGKEHDGSDLVDAGSTPGARGPETGLWLADDGTAPPRGRALASGPRIGISAAAEVEWRYWVGVSSYVSGARDARRPREALDVPVCQSTSWSGR
jgi:DNA-3-methyladenine glycosylase